MTDTTDWRAEAERLRGERDELKSDLAESDAVRDQLADLLHRTAIAVRGPEPELTRWSWHDVPDRVAAAIAALGGAAQAAAEAMRERDELAARLAEIEQAERHLSSETIARLMPSATISKANVERWDRAALHAFARSIERELIPRPSPAAAPERAEPTFLVWGRTAQQIREAPHGAVFIWCNERIDYPLDLARHLGRGDLQIRPRSWLRRDNVAGRRQMVIIDHAARVPGWAAAMPCRCGPDSVACQKGGAA